LSALELNNQALLMQ